MAKSPRCACNTVDTVFHSFIYPVATCRSCARALQTSHRSSALAIYGWLAIGAAFCKTSIAKAEEESFWPAECVPLLVAVPLITLMATGFASGFCLIERAADGSDHPSNIRIVPWCRASRNQSTAGTCRSGGLPDIPGRQRLWRVTYRPARS